MSSSQKDVDILSKLADQYRDKGKVNPRKNWADILKAHTLYNACASRSSNKKWRQQAFQVQKTYWEDGVTSTIKEQTEAARDFQAQLYTIRDDCKDDLSPVTDLIKRWDCTTDNLDSADNKEITRQLVNEIKTPSFVANAKMKVFAGKVIQKSVEINKKKVPCRFAAVALGSMAKGEATPYSDLEFMFLLETKTPEILEYFETLAMTVYFLIGNLKETKLKYMNIEELKTFKDTGKNGFKIDGLQSKAGNIPTGNGTREQQNKFILTVDEILDRYQHIFLNPDPEDSKKGDFTSMLAHTTVIYGESSLLTDFEQRKNKVVINEARINAHSNMIKQDVEDYDFLPLSKLFGSNQRANLKSAIYRFPSILATNLKIVFNIESKTSWETLDRLYQMKKLSQSFYISLQFLLASALYIRMAAYLHHNSQNDDMTFVPSSNPQSQGPFWHIPKQLRLHMSLHMIPVKQTIAKLNNPIHALTTEIAYDTDIVSAHVNYLAENHAEALKVLESLTVKGFGDLTMLVDCYWYLHQWNKCQTEVFNIIRYIQERPYNPFLTSMLPYYKYRAADCYNRAGDLASAKKGYEEVLSDLPSHLMYNHDIYAHASDFYISINEESKSKFYYEKACAHLEQIAPIIGQSRYECCRSVMVHNRAVSLMKKPRYREVEGLLLQNMKLLKRLYGENGICIQLANGYHALGNVYGALKQFGKSLDYLQKSEELYNAITPAHEETNLAVRYEGIALAYQRQGNLDRALEYYRKTLVQREKHGTQNCSVVADLKNKIVTVLAQQGKYVEAERFLKDSIAIYNALNDSLYDNRLAKSHLFYGQLCIPQDRHAETLNHFYKATSFRYKSDDIDHIDTVCEAWSFIGKISLKACKYEEAALSFEKSTSIHHLHSGINIVTWAMIYFNLGRCYLCCSKTNPAPEKLLAHAKAHKAYVKALSLLISRSSAEEDYSLDILRVAAGIFMNMWIWHDPDLTCGWFMYVG